MQDNSKNITKNNFLLALPYLKQERSQKFFGIVLTLCALAFFGLFAIKPTISTVLKLQKELSDNQFVLNQLQTKIKNLTGLKKQYADLESDLPFVINAITTQPDVSILFAQIQSIGQQSNIAIKELQSFEVEVLRNNSSASKNYYSYSFTIVGVGSFENISKFLQILTNMERIVNIDTFSIDNAVSQNDGSLEFNIKGLAFFKK